MSDIEIEIDGKPLKAKPNSMVMQVADEAGIYIPRFCYHKHLSVAANCRMCLVEVEKSPKPLPACATPVTPGMKVLTRSPKAMAAQKAVMEFLLINHPLDCPICDQGGECELQDLSMGYGSAESYFTEGKRAVKDQDIGPLIATDMTRCIQCTRCVRFGTEVAGQRELGAVNRGEHMKITTYIERALHSELSGNIIDLCPVGALTSKPFRFTARPWELTQYPSVAVHDCLGSNIYVHTRRGDVMRVVPRENEAINLTWISDRDRFSYEGLHHIDRLAKPWIRVDRRWQETDWSTALTFAARGLQRVIVSDPKQLGALASPNATLEELYLLQKLVRQLGSPSIDHRLRQVDFADQDDMPMMPGLTMAMKDIEQSDAILLVGSRIQQDQPIAALRVRQAALNQAHVLAVNMMDDDVCFQQTVKRIVAPHQFVNTLAAIAKALIGEQPEWAEIEVTEHDSIIATHLQNSKKAVILVGLAAFNHPEASHIRRFTQCIAKACGAKVGFLTDGCNAAGAWLAGAIPHRAAQAHPVSEVGLNANTMWHEARKAYVLFNVEPDLDCANPVAAAHALEQAEFTVAFSVFQNPLLSDYAHVILPIAAFTETSGTFINAMGDWQTIKGMASPYGEARPAWKVLRTLANLLHLEGFDHDSTEAVRQEVESISVHPLQENTGSVPVLKASYAALSRIGDIPLYAGDSLVRHAKALQATQSIIEGELAAVRMHPALAAALSLKPLDKVTVKQGRYHGIRLPVILDQRVPEQAVYIPAALAATNGLSELFGSIEIQK